MNSIDDYISELRKSNIKLVNSVFVFVVCVELVVYFFYESAQHFIYLTIGMAGICDLIYFLRTKTDMYIRGARIEFEKNPKSYVFSCVVMGVFSIISLYVGVFGNKP